MKDSAQEGWQCWKECNLGHNTFLSHAWYITLKQNRTAVYEWVRRNGWAEGKVGHRLWEVSMTGKWPQ